MTWPRLPAGNRGLSEGSLPSGGFSPSCPSWTQTEGQTNWTILLLPRPRMFLEVTPPARAPSEPSTWSITRRNLGAWGAPVSSLEVLEVMSA